MTVDIFPCFTVDVGKLVGTGSDDVAVLGVGVLDPVYEASGYGVPDVGDAAEGGELGTWVVAEGMEIDVVDASEDVVTGTLLSCKKEGV